MFAHAGSEFAELGVEAEFEETICLVHYEVDDCLQAHPRLLSLVSFHSPSHSPLLSSHEGEQMGGRGREMGSG